MTYNQTMNTTSQELTEISVAGDDDIICYTVHGVLYVETDYDFQAKVKGEWFNIDENGYLTHKMTVH